jgi:hypothetical protein
MSPIIKLDFTDVDDAGGGRFPVLEGTFKAVVESIDRGLSRSSNEPQLTWTYKITAGKHKGETLKEWTQLTGNGAFRTKQRLESLGYETKKKMALDTDDLVGTPVLVQLGTPRTYNGQKVNNIVAVALQSEAVDTEEEELETPVKRPKVKKQVEEEPEEEEEESEPVKVAKPKKLKVRTLEEDED